MCSGTFDRFHQQTDFASLLRTEAGLFCKLFERVKYLHKMSTAGVLETVAPNTTPQKCINVKQGFADCFLNIFLVIKLEQSGISGLTTSVSENIVDQPETDPGSGQFRHRGQTPLTGYKVQSLTRYRLFRLTPM